MKEKLFAVLIVATLLSTLTAPGIAGKEKGQGKIPAGLENDLTYRLFQLLDSIRGQVDGLLRFG